MFVYIHMSILIYVFYYIWICVCINVSKSKLDKLGRTSFSALHLRLHWQAQRYVCIYIFTSIRPYLYLNAYIYMYLNAYIYIHMCVCVYIAKLGVDRLARLFLFFPSLFLRYTPGSTGKPKGMCINMFISIFLTYSIHLTAYIYTCVCTYFKVESG